MKKVIERIKRLFAKKEEPTKKETALKIFLYQTNQSFMGVLPSPKKTL
jgi:hypothetical protein